MEKKVPEIIQETSGTLISLNQKQLFDARVGSDGLALGYYSKATEKLSNGRKKAGDPVTLFDTGAFYKGFFLSVDKDRIIFDSKDSKTKLLDQRYGSDNIFGLTSQSKSDYIDIFKSKLKDYISKQTGLI